jgi:hypothetical protein
MPENNNIIASTNEPEYKLAHGYIPFQQMAEVFPPMEGLRHGTIFPELARPYGTDPEYMYDE